MLYAQYKSGLQLHLVCEPGEEYRGQVIRKGFISHPLCHIRMPIPYRMTINMPLGHACKLCLKVAAREPEPKEQPR